MALAASLVLYGGSLALVLLVLQRAAPQGDPPTDAVTLLFEAPAQQLQQPAGPAPQDQAPSAPEVQPESPAPAPPASKPSAAADPAPQGQATLTVPIRYRLEQ